MSDDVANDAAFGTAPQMLASEAQVKELQMLLNAKGAGPIAVDGRLTDELMAKARAFGVVLNGPTAGDVADALTQLKAPAIGPNAVPSNAPLWKSKNFLFGAAAVLAVVGYVAFRAGAFDEAPALSDAEPEPEAKPKKKTKPTKAKCDLDVPEVDFDDAEPLTVES